MDSELGFDFLRLDMDQYMPKFRNICTQGILEQVRNIVAFTDGDIPIYDSMQVPMVFHSRLADWYFGGCLLPPVSLGAIHGSIRRGGLVLWGMPATPSFTGGYPQINPPRRIGTLNSLWR
jgi:hypothetical protein